LPATAPSLLYDGTLAVRDNLPVAINPPNSPAPNNNKNAVVITMILEAAYPDGSTDDVSDCSPSLSMGGGATMLSAPLLMDPHDPFDEGSVMALVETRQTEKGESNALPQSLPYGSNSFGLDFILIVKVGGKQRNVTKPFQFKRKLSIDTRCQVIVGTINLCEENAEVIVAHVARDSRSKNRRSDIERLLACRNFVQRVNGRGSRSTVVSNGIGKDAECRDKTF
jgi:hypothetical protein